MRRTLAELLHDYDLPLTAFTEEAAFEPDAAPLAFLRACCSALLRPGAAIPARPLLELLQSMEAKAANPLRKVLTMQLSLVPELRTDSTVNELPGGHLLGTHLLVVHVDAEDRADCLLPSGRWTELGTDTVYEGHYRRLCGINEQPVLARENALIPVNGQSMKVRLDEADQLTLHWFQPQEQAACMLADGTAYYVRLTGKGYSLTTNTAKPWHLVVHRDEEELTASSLIH